MSKQIILSAGAGSLITGTRYWGVVSGSGPKSADNLLQLISAAGTIRNLRATMLSAPGAGASYSFTILKNGSATGAPTFTIADTDTTGADTSTDLSVAAGDRMSLRTISSGSPASSLFKFCFEFEGTTAKETNLMGFVNTTSFTAGTTYYNVVNGGLTNQTITTRTNQMVAASGTFKNLYVQTKVAPGAGESVSVELIKNFVATGVIATVSDTATTASDTSNTITVAAGDYVFYKIVVSASAATGAVPGWGITWLSDVDGQSLIMGGNADRQNKDVVEYNHLNGSGISWTTTETTANVLGQGSSGNTVTISDLYIRLSDGAITTGSYTFTVRQNGADTSLSGILTDRTASDTVNSFEVSDGDLLALEDTPSTGTLPSGIKRVAWGALMTIEAAATSSTLTGVSTLTGISTLTF